MPELNLIKLRIKKDNYKHTHTNTHTRVGWMVSAKYGFSAGRNF